MISSLKTAIGYRTNGSQKRFPFPYALIDGDHLEITLDDIPVESGYTVTLETNRDLGAVVEFTTAPATGQVLAISRATPITQTETFETGSNFDGDKFEGGLDKLTMIIQERGFVCGDCIPLETTVLAAAANGTDQIDLTWNAVEDPSRTGYELQRSLDGETGWITVASPAADDTSASDTELDDDTTYYFRIRAVGGVLESEWSNIANATTDLAIPDAPSSLVATEDGTDTIDLTWTDNSDNETSFIVQQSPDGSTGWTTISTPSAGMEADSATGLTEGTQYFFRVAAVNAAGTSAWSNTANDFTLPAAPSDLVATAISDTEIGLTWVDNSAAETSFSIERSLDGATGWTEVLTPAANAESASDTGLTAETEYFYRIKALRSGDSSAYSNTDSATTAAAVVLVYHWHAGDYTSLTTDWEDRVSSQVLAAPAASNLKIDNWEGTGQPAVDFDGSGDAFLGDVDLDDFLGPAGKCTIVHIGKADALKFFFAYWRDISDTSKITVLMASTTSSGTYRIRRTNPTTDEIEIASNASGWHQNRFIHIMTVENGDPIKSVFQGQATARFTKDLAASPMTPEPHAVTQFRLGHSSKDGQMAQFRIYDDIMSDDGMDDLMDELAALYL